MFGNAGTTNASGGMLFGNTAGNTSNPAQNNQQPANSLFGNTGQNQNSAQPQQSGGIFGNLGNQNKPAGASLLYVNSHLVIQSIFR